MATSVGLWDLKDERIFVKLKPDFVKSMFDAAINMAGNQRMLARRLDLVDSMICFYKKGNNFIQIGVLSSVLDMLPEGMKKEFESGIVENIIGINHGSGRAKPMKLSFPIEFSPQMARICGHLLGDGSINIVNRVSYGNTCWDLTEVFKDDIRKVFGCNTPTEEYLNRKFNCKSVCCSTLIGVILKHFFGEMRGDYKNIPPSIFNADTDSKRLFIRALFDDEGHVGVSSCVIQINMTIKSVLEGVKQLLGEFGILTGKISEYQREGKKNIYALRVCGRDNIILFHELIGFDHPKKDKLTRECIEAYKHKRNMYGKPEHAREMMLKFIDEKGEATKQEIAVHLKRTPTSLKYHLLWLERHGMVKSRSDNVLKVYAINR